MKLPHATYYTITISILLSLLHLCRNILLCFARIYFQLNINTKYQLNINDNTFPKYVSTKIRYTYVPYIFILDSHIYIYLCGISFIIHIHKYFWANSHHLPPPACVYYLYQISFSC